MFLNPVSDFMVINFDERTTFAFARCLSIVPVLLLAMNLQETALNGGRVTCWGKLHEGRVRGQRGGHRCNFRLMRKRDVLVQDMELWMRKKWMTEFFLLDGFLVMIIKRFRLRKALWI